MNGIESAVESFPALQTVRVGCIDGYGQPTHRYADIVAVETNGLTEPASPSHAGSQMGQVQFVNRNRYPVQLIDVWVRHTAGGLYDGIITSLQHNPVVVYTSFDVDSITMATAPAQQCEAHDVVWVGPSHDTLDSPADIADLYDNILVALATDEQGNPRETVRDWALGVVADGSSGATSRLAFYFAWARAAFPDASWMEIIDAMRNTGDPHPDGFVNLRMDRAAAHLAGMEMPKPSPAPEPTPTPEPIMTRAVTPIGTFESDLPFNAERGEGLAQGFDGDPKTKALSFNSSVYLDYTADGEMEPAQGLFVITANDFPRRNPRMAKVTFIDGHTETTYFTTTEEKFTEIRAPLNFDPNDITGIELFNVSGDIIQWAELGFVAVSTEPMPEPTPKPVKVYPSSLTMTFPDGTTKEYTL